MVRFIQVLLWVSLLCVAGCSQQIDSYQADIADYDRFDDDSDGVINARDMCSETLLGAEINNDGCSHDQLHQESYELMVFFPHDSSELSNTYVLQLEQVADFMQRYPEVKVNVEGHASASGNQEYNLALSERRAKVVQDYLINDFSVSESRVKLVAYGEQELLSDSGDTQGETANRRVRIYLQERYRRVIPQWTIYSPEQE